MDKARDFTEQLSNWATSASPGARFTYAAGATHAHKAPGGMRTAQEAYRLYERGVVDLVQKRVSDAGHFDYIAIKRRGGMRRT